MEFPCYHFFTSQAKSQLKPILKFMASQNQIKRKTENLIMLAKSYLSYSAHLKPIFKLVIMGTKV